jgi:hypothetical protein
MTLSARTSTLGGIAYEFWIFDFGFSIAGRKLRLF